MGSKDVGEEVNSLFQRQGIVRDVDTSNTQVMPDQVLDRISVSTANLHFVDDTVGQKELVDVLKEVRADEPPSLMGVYAVVADLRVSCQRWFV